MGSVGAVGAAPVLSRDVVVAAVRDLAYVLSCCSDVSAALAGPFPLGTETWPLALPPLPHTRRHQTGSASCFTGRFGGRRRQFGAHAPASFGGTGGPGAGGLSWGGGASSSTSRVPGYGNSF